MVIQMTADEFEKKLRQTNLSQNTIDSYMHTIKKRTVKGNTWTAIRFPVIVLRQKSRLQALYILFLSETSPSDKFYGMLIRHSLLPLIKLIPYSFRSDAFQRLTINISNSVLLREGDSVHLSATFCVI